MSSSKRKRRKFSPEQKAEAVRLVRETGSASQVARDFDLTETALREWVRRAEIDEERAAQRQSFLPTDDNFSSPRTKV